MKTAMIVVFTVLAAVRGNAAQPAVALEIKDDIRDPRVIAAMIQAWEETAGSLKKDCEAGFRIDADPTAEKGYNVIAEPATNENSKQTMSIVVGKTIALYHVHPLHTDPRPSEADRKIADTYGLRIYVMHMSGLYVYDPVSRKTTKLMDNLSWLKP